MDLKKVLKTINQIWKIPMNRTWLVILLFSGLMGQSLNVQDLAISSKKNGVSIQLRSDKPIHSTQITGWYNTSSSWYYITIFEATGDTTRLESVKIEYPIREVEVMHVGESLQLGFRMAIPVEQFEFYHSNSPPEVLTALRFPLSDIMASMAEEKRARAPDLPAVIQEKPIWPKALYFMGAGLTGAGFLAGEDQKGWEVTVGMGLIAVAYVYENIIIGKKK